MNSFLRAFVDPAGFYSVSHWVYLRNWKICSKVIDGFSRWWFGCIIPGSATIGKDCRFGYGGLGIVIHKDAYLGTGVNIGPGVVIGGHGKKPGVPRIGDRVVIGAGAKVLGAVVVGDGAYIGANAVVNSDIPPFATAVGIPARVLKK